MTAISFDDSGRLILIHGVAESPMGFTYGHAWLFDPADNTVFDTATQKWYAATEFSGTERRRYTQLEAATLMNESGHFGPWD